MCVNRGNNSSLLCEKGMNASNIGQTKKQDSKSDSFFWKKKQRSLLCGLILSKFSFTDKKNSNVLSASSYDKSSNIHRTSLGKR